MADATSSAKLVLMGRIGAAHGIKGQVRIQSFTQDPQAIADYGPLATDRPGLSITVTEARPAGNVVIARLKGITDRNAAEALNGVSLFVERDRLPQNDDEDDFYHADLIGLEARLADGTVLGAVVAVPNFGAGDLIEVRPSQGGTLLYPFTRAAVPQISLSGGYLVIVPPEEIEAEEPNG